MTTNTSYNEHISIVKNLTSYNAKSEAQEEYHDSFEKIYTEAKEQNIGLADAKAFLYSLNKEELSTLQHYTNLADGINIDDISDEGAFNLLVDRNEKYDFNNDGIVEDGKAQSISLIPQSLDNTTKKALVETYNAMDSKDIMMISMMMLPLEIDIIDGKIVPVNRSYSSDEIKDHIQGILDDTANENNSSEFINSMRTFLDLFTKTLEEIEKEEKAILESYTQNNKPNPLEEAQMQSGALNDIKTTT